MQVRFWGTRGSIASPGPQTAKFGGNTSCVQVVAGDGTQIILDCGTGARPLGQHLVDTKTTPLRVHLFIGHTHWDHIQGFPFFMPVFLPDTELNVYAPRGFQRNLEETLAGQMQHAYFPLKLRELRSRIQFTQLEEGFFRLGNVLVETQALNHTAPTIAYRISTDGATVAYSTDHEPYWKPVGAGVPHPGDQRHVDFFKDADLVIHDAQYAEPEYLAKRGWGHSTVEYATDVAMAANARRLALFHHDPMRSDQEVEAFERVGQQRALDRGMKTEVFAAAEGLTIDIEGTRSARQVAQMPAIVHRPIAGRCVLIVGADERSSSLIDQEMREDNLVLVNSPDVRAASAHIRELAPDIVIVDAGEERPAETVGRLRGALDGSAVPIIVLTDDVNTDVELLGGSLSNTDFLAKPFSPPMLRSRVRAWLARTAELSPESGHGTSARVEGSPTRSARGPAMTREDIREALAGISLFTSLSTDELDLLSAGATERFHESGEVMIRQGERSDQLFVILKGSARVQEMPDDPSATEMVLGEIGAGQIVGELAVLTGMPRSATVVAIEATHCLGIAGEDFTRLMRKSAVLAGALAQVLARRIYETDQRLTRFAPDALTSLLTRQTFQDHYRRVAAQARRRGTGVMLLFFDVTSLKAVNDSSGYEVGDEVLRTVAHALRESARDTDLIARWGGDEFAVLPVDALPIAVEMITGRLREKLGELCEARNLPVVQCAFGVESAQVPPESAEELVRAADEDMQRRLAAQAGESSTQSS